MTATAATITRTQEEMLLKLRKGSAAWLNAKKLEEILSLVGGWTVEKNVLVYLPSDEKDAMARIKDRKPLGYNNGVSVYGMRLQEGSTMGLEAIGFDRKTDHAPLKALREFLIGMVVAEIPEATKKSPDAVVTAVGEITGKKMSSTTSGENPVFHFSLSVKVKALRVTAPNGKSFDIAQDRDLGYGGRQDFQKFFAWATENTDVMAQILGVLGMDPHVKKADQPREVKEGQTLGTCAICGRQHVVRGKDNKVVLHGYTRPGIGFIMGDCFGVGYQPYELSAKACEDYAVKMADYIVRKQGWLGKLRSGEVTEVYIEVGSEYVRGQRVPKLEKIGPEHAKFAGKIADMIAKTENEIGNATAIKAEMERKVRDWTPGDLITG